MGERVNQMTTLAKQMTFCYDGHKASLRWVPLVDSMSLLVNLAVFLHVPLKDVCDVHKVDMYKIA